MYEVFLIVLMSIVMACGLFMIFYFHILFRLKCKVLSKNAIVAESEKGYSFEESYSPINVQRTLSREKRHLSRFKTIHRY